MILKKLKLENIRSYENAEIDFPKGITLLSGDIGSGKSTIFLAIEFCLFGIQRGTLSSGGILRHGTNNGSIELTFEIDSKEIQIKRLLKRSSSNTITQDPGFIVIDDQPKQLSPTEIKSKVIELLGYPPESLTKKSPIYRYTVFTPQEHMKTILTSDKESRIDTLRMVFDIDKYKIIRANAKILVQELKIKRKEYASMIYDLEDKKEERTNKEKRIAELEIEKNKINTEELKITLDKLRYELVKLEEEIKDVENLKQNIKLKEQKIDQIIMIRQKNNERLIKIKEKLTRAESYDKPKYSSEEIKIQRQTYEDTVKTFEEKSKELQEIIVRLRTNKERSIELSNKIKNLNNCPTCLQIVQETHKTNIIQTEVSKINSYNKELEKQLHQERDLKVAIGSAKSKLEHILKEENKLKVQELMDKEINEIRNELTNLEKEEESLKNQIGKLNQEKIQIEDKLKLTENLEYNYNQKKDELNKLQEEEREFSIQYATKTKEINMIKDEIEYLNKEIKIKEKTKHKLQRYTQVQEWIETMFIQMMLEIEKATMFKIKNEFDHLLQQWFNMLVEDESITITIDEDFTPIIEQNGHTTEYDYLSGGERTAAALAYRLALNQTINDVISKIKTKDLILLDEPTEGFSSEQLNKLRDILEQLDVKQILIVSHESKVESFVENVIKITKESGKSKISY